jgi:hypothetical protein
MVRDDILQLKNEVQVLQQQNQVIKNVLYFNENFHDLKYEGYHRDTDNSSQKASILAAINYGFQLSPFASGLGCSFIGRLV